jgi:hypothetical protein
MDRTRRWRLPMSADCFSTAPATMYLVQRLDVATSVDGISLDSTSTKPPNTGLWRRTCVTAMDKQVWARTTYLARWQRNVKSLLSSRRNGLAPLNSFDAELQQLVHLPIRSSARCGSAMRHRDRRNRPGHYLQLSERRPHSLRTNGIIQERGVKHQGSPENGIKDGCGEKYRSVVTSTRRASSFVGLTRDSTPDSTATRDGVVFTASLQRLALVLGKKRMGLDSRLRSLEDAGHDRPEVSGSPLSGSGARAGRWSGAGARRPFTRRSILRRTLDRSRVGRDRDPGLTVPDSGW